jgi:hypothetical protein
MPGLNKDEHKWAFGVKVFHENFLSMDGFKKVNVLIYSERDSKIRSFLFQTANSSCRFK